MTHRERKASQFILVSQVALILLIAVFLDSSCKKAPPTVELLVKNNTGNEISEVTVDYGTGTMVYQIFCRDCTHKTEVNVSQPRSIRIQYIDENRYARFIEVENQLTPEMGGKNATIWINPNGEVKTFF